MTILTALNCIPKEAWGLIGVALGGFLAFGADLIRRRSDRRQKARELLIQRGEELLQKCQELYEWLETARKGAYSGDMYIPVQTPLFRVTTIVKLYYPTLASHVELIDTAAVGYRSGLVDVAAAKMKGETAPTHILENSNKTLVHLISTVKALWNAAIDTVAKNVS